MIGSLPSAWYVSLRLMPSLHSCCFTTRSRRRWTYCRCISNCEEFCIYTCSPFGIDIASRTQQLWWTNYQHTRRTKFRHIDFVISFAWRLSSAWCIALKWLLVLHHWYFWHRWRPFWKSIQNLSFRLHYKLPSRFVWCQTRFWIDLQRRNVWYLVRSRETRLLHLQKSKHSRPLARISFLGSLAIADQTPKLDWLSRRSVSFAYNLSRQPVVSRKGSVDLLDRLLKCFV